MDALTVKIHFGVACGIVGVCSGMCSNMPTLIDCNSAELCPA